MTTLLRRVTGSWKTSAGTASAATVSLGLLLFACVLLALAGPRFGVQLQTNAVRQVIARTPVAEKVIQATAPYAQADPAGPPLSVSQIAEVGQQLRNMLAHLPLTGASTDLLAFTSGFTLVEDTAPSLRIKAVQLELVYSSHLDGNVRLIRGKLPSMRHLSATASKVTFPIAVTEATARQFGLSVGFRLPVPGTEATLQVAGIIQPSGPSKPFWSIDPIESVPNLVTPRNAAPYWQGGAFIGANELVPFENAVGTTNGTLRWVLPLRLGNLTIGQARGLAVALPPALVQDGNGLVASSNNFFTATLFSGVAAELTAFVQQANAIETLLNLVSLSLTAIGATVLLLAVWLLTEQRYDEFETLRARGASRRQLSLLTVRGSSLAMLLGGGLGVGAALAATPDDSTALGWWQTTVIVLVVLVGLPGITMRRHRNPAIQGRRPDRPTGRRAAARRLVIESALVLASAGGLVLLHDHGLTPGRPDPYASLAPVLVAIPVAVIVLRCYPAAIRPLLRLTGRHRGVTAFVGLARAVRTTPTAALPVFALVLTLTLVAFAGMVRGAVLRGEVTASWQEVGADAAISSPFALSPAQLRAIAAVPGVQHTAALTVTTGLLPGNYRQFGVVLVDPRQYEALLAGTPAQSASAVALRADSATSSGGRAWALAAGGLGAAVSSRGTTVDIGPGAQPVRVRIAGQVPVSSVISAVIGAQYLVLPRSALGASAEPPTDMLVVGAHLNVPDLTRAVRRLPPGTSLQLRRQVLTGLQDAPLQRNAYVAFAIGSAVAAVLSLLVLLLALVIGGRSRQQTLARMSTMGLSRSQGRRLAMLEALPLILAAVIGGAGCAVLLAPLVGPALDLSVFTGTIGTVPVQVEYAVLAGAAVGLGLLAMITLTVQTGVASRRTAAALRIGE
jgi:putative ABC transport system permease protein